MKTLIKNIDIVTSEKVIENGFCVIDGGSIDRFGQSMPEMGEEYAVIDGEWGYLLPGFVDIHCHGADNLDFMDADAEGFNRIAEYHLKNGTTTMLATTLADSPDATEKSIRTLANTRKNTHRAPSRDFILRVLGSASLRAARRRWNTSKIPWQMSFVN